MSKALSLGEVVERDGKALAQAIEWTNYKLCEGHRETIVPVGVADRVVAEFESRGWRVWEVQRNSLVASLRLAGPEERV